MTTVPKQVLVVGAGCFGLSTALHCLQRGHKVRVIDAAETLPASDAASTDINKIVRSSYSDVFYSRLGRDAIAEWKKPAWQGAYQESGVMILGEKGDRNGYAAGSFENDKATGARVVQLTDADAIASRFPPNTPLGDMSKQSGYINLDGGWAHATLGLQACMEQIVAFGGQIEGGHHVVGLSYDGEHRVTGVKLHTGTTLTADIIVIATGSWTPSTFANDNLGLSGRLLATGQSLVTIQLTDEESARYKDCPVVWRVRDGFYCFPPNKDGIVKVSMHTAGLTNPVVYGSTTISTPRTSRSHQNGTAIPLLAIQDLRRELGTLYPELSRKPFVGTRVCWYTDTPDSDWILDFHPDHPSLFFATGGSGHAYKFLPVIGRLAADRIDGVLEHALVQKFSFSREYKHEDLSRLGHKAQVLDPEKLGTDADWNP